MARTVEEILKMQLGNLLAEVAVLTAKVEEQTELLMQHQQAGEAEKPMKAIK